MTLDTGLAARLIAGLRANTPGASQWDTPGIAAALREVGGTPGAAFAAAALAAEDASLTKPSAAGFRNHWPVNAGVAGPRISHDMPCPEHPTQVHPCPTCRDIVRPPTATELKVMKRLLKSSGRPVPKHAQTQQATTDLTSARHRADIEGITP